MGRWWGTDPATRSQAELDIVAPGMDGRILLGECKWTKEKVGIDILDGLRARSALFAGQEPVFFLFARSGSADAASNVHLVDFAEIAATLM